MNFLTAMVLVTTISSGQPTDYTSAYKSAMKSDQPLVVLVTAEWCPPCQNLKRNTLPKLVDRKSFKGVHFALVDLDKDSKVARQLIGSRPIPQFILFEKKDGKWTKKHLVGFQTVAKVEEFVGPAIVRTAEKPATDKAIANK